LAFDNFLTARRRSGAKAGRRFLLPLALLVSFTTAAKCITVADDPTIVVNVENLSHTYSVAPGTTSFTNPNDCVVRNVADYLDEEYGDIVGGRLVDVQVQTFGAFSGSISSGSVSVNGIQMLSYNGPWSNFETKRSLLTGSELQRHSAGVDELIDAVANSQPVTLCVGGSFTEAAPSGLSVKLDVLAQVDVSGG
jgi:hypothetical protein